MHRRLNITLPEETVRLLDRAVPKGERSRLIAKAIQYYVQEMGRSNVRKRLREGATHRSERDRKLAEEWFAVDEEAWQGHAR